MLAALVTTVASGAEAANLVQVRVGRHPTFTRVVFELDAASGYRIARPAGQSEVRVTLDAASRARRIDTQSIAIRSVVVEPAAGRAVARISARKPNPVIREMMLADPPRIVLDFMLDEAQLAAAHAPVRRPAPAAEETAHVVADARTAARPEVVRAERVPEPEVAEPEAAPAPIPVASEPVAEPEPLVAEPVAEPEPLVAEPVVEPEPVVEEPAPAEPEIAAAEPAPPPGIEEPVEIESEPVVPEPSPVFETQGSGPEGIEVAVEEPADLAAGSEVPAPETGIAQPEQAEAQPAPQERPAPSRVRVPAGDGGLSPLMLGAIAGGVIAVLLVLFVVMRGRRSRRDEIDVMALAEASDGAPSQGFTVASPTEEASHSGDEFSFSSGGPSRDDGARKSALADELFSGTAEATPAAAPAARSFPARAPAEPETAAAAAHDSSGPGSGLFDETPKGEGDMDQDMDLPISHTEGIASPPPAARSSMASGGGDADTLQIVHELERRIESLAKRLDESNEARERLERQVEAQAEELRVQRAAIARTQRALRSLSRSDEEQVTEPALREPGR